MWKSRRIFFYFLSEMIPSFLLGIVVFISILLMFQALRLTEFMLIHGITFGTILNIMGYMSLSMLPLILPMSLLFSILMTYNRLSVESEIIAMKGIGYSGISLLLPALTLSLVITYFSAMTAYDIAPWGNRQFEVLISQLGNTKAAASIKEGTFSEGFFDMVVYANKVNSDQGLLEDLFIYDEKNPDSPLTIIAPRGQIIPDSENPGHSVQLRMFNGQLHKRNQTHTVVHFKSYDIFLNDPIQIEERKKSPPSLSLAELNHRRQNSDFTTAEKNTYNLEYHKRSALSFACLIFGLVGVAFGIQLHGRSGKASGFITAVGFIILYWIIYLSFESTARSGHLSPWISAWGTNIVFLIFTIYNLRKKLI
jgi:lipopolysaccharide export system permease protein